MMSTIETYVRAGQGRIRKLSADPRVRLAGKVTACFTGGFVLSAASLANAPQPLAMAAVLAMSGYPAAVLALGGSVGYLFFWGQAGHQGLLWLVLGLSAALLLGKRPVQDEAPLLMGAIGGLIAAVSGLFFQLWRSDATPVPVYLLRVFLAAGTTRLFQLVRDRRDPVADWLGEGIGVLALSQIAPFGFSLGYPAGALLAAGGAFPAAALAGLALDLAKVTPTPMTAVMCLSYLTRMLPLRIRPLRYLAPGMVYILVMGLSGHRDLTPVAGLFLGGFLSVLLPPRPELSHRRGETGLAQVRLELMAGVLNQTQQLLLESSGLPIDEAALLARTQERCCGSCPCRKTCRDRLSPLPENLLHKPLFDTTSLPLSCKKPGRLIMELRRTQEQLRSIKADRDRQQEYRAAVIQQYQFLGTFLQQLSDQLPRRGDHLRQQYHPLVQVRSTGKETANGDTCIWFAGTGCRYYVLLCDGMGTGLGASQEGQTAASLLRQMLSAGFPAEHALRSLNSLLALRGRAAAVTVDLAELRLDSGRATVYKWGAAPSYLADDVSAEKIGTAGPPPGMSVTNTRETAHRLSLRRGEVLILVSDGVDGEAVRRRIHALRELPPGELAAGLLECCALDCEDDATVAVIALKPGASTTS